MLLDLVEHVADLSRGAADPAPLPRAARAPRPAPGLGRRQAERHEPAARSRSRPTRAAACSTALGAQRFRSLRDTIIAGAEGNPLFLEEMLALARDQTGDGELAVPPTIHALLAARLDRLEPAERIVLERGAVEGKHFHEQALEALTPEESDVQARLKSLVRRELIRPAPAAISGSTRSAFATS